MEAVTVKAKEKKTSGLVVLACWAIVVLMATFSIFFGYDWYLNGNLRVCLAGDSTGWGRPNNSPIAWCAPHTSQPESVPCEKIPGDLLDSLSPTDWCAPHTSQPESNVRTSEDDPQCVNISGDFQAYFKCKSDYNLKALMRGAPAGDDFFTLFFEDVGQVLGRIMSELWESFRESFGPSWNDFFADDNEAAKAHRFSLAAVAVVIFTTILASAWNGSLAWLHERAP